MVEFVAKVLKPTWTLEKMLVQRLRRDRLRRKVKYPFRETSMVYRVEQLGKQNVIQSDIPILGNERFTALEVEGKDHGKS